MAKDNVQKVQPVAATWRKGTPAIRGLLSAVDSAVARRDTLLFSTYSRALREELESHLALCKKELGGSNA